MNLESLATFDRIVREGSFGRAALALDLGQPAVSARIHALEGELGGTLFHRGRRVTLTALGESLLPYARRALDILGEGLEAARLAQTGQRGRVRLGCLGSLAGGLAGPAFGAFLKAHPEVDCTARSGPHELVVGLVLDGVLELGVVAWPCREGAAGDLQPLLLFREPVPLVAGRGHPLAARRSVTRDELAVLGRPLLRLRWWQQHHPAVLGLAERAGAALDLPMEAARQVALDGAGVGFFTRTYVAEDLARGDLVEVGVRDLAPLERESALVRRRGAAPLSPASAALVEALRRQALRLGLLAQAGRAGGPTPRRRRAGRRPR